jgi:hypothetical protein
MRTSNSTEIYPIPLIELVSLPQVLQDLFRVNPKMSTKLSAVIPVERVVRNGFVRIRTPECQQYLLKILVRNIGHKNWELTSTSCRPAPRSISSLSRFFCWPLLSLGIRMNYSGAGRVTYRIQRLIIVTRREKSSKKTTSEGLSIT